MQIYKIQSVFLDLIMIKQKKLFQLFAPNNKRIHSLFFLLFPGVLFGQFAEQLPRLDTVYLINGKVLLSTETQVDSNQVTLQHVKGKRKREKRVVLEMVYAVAFAGGGDTILYEPDTVNGFYFTQEQMGYFVAGQRDARMHYRSHVWGVTGLVLGGAIGYAAYDQFYVIAFPFVYTVLAGATQPRLSGREELPIAMIQNQAYLAGFQRVARSRKVFNALRTSLVGTALGVTIGNLAR